MLVKSSFLLDLILSCCDETLEKQNILWERKKSMCVVLCSNGYPDFYKKNVEIPNIEKVKNNDTFFVYHAGTEKKNNKVYANGGRVLNFVSISDNLKLSREKVIREIEKLNWDNGFYRRDIGYKIIDKWELLEEVLKEKNY